MERKPKDINELYNEMEQIVARQVQETIDLADSRRGLLSTGVFISTRKQGRESEDRAKESGQKEHEASAVLGTNQQHTLENTEGELVDIKRVVQTEGNILNNDFVQQEDEQKVFENVDKIEEETQNEVIKSVDAEKDTNFKEREIENVPNFETVPTQVEEKSQIGFEHFTEPSINDPLNRLPEPLITFKENILEVALNPAQNTISDTDETANKTVENIVETQTILSNNPFEIIEDATTPLTSGENALTLTETAVRSYGSNPFESSDDEVEIRLTTKNPFDTVDDPFEARRFEQEALNASQNVYLRNPFDIFDDEEGDIRKLGAEALSIAQSGATSVEAAKRQLSENEEDIDNVFDSLIDTEELQKPLAQIGFDYLEQALEEQIRDTARHATKNNQEF